MDETTHSGRMAEAHPISTPGALALPTSCGSGLDVDGLARVCVDHPLPSKRPCGVYFLLLRGAVVYVGQTGHITARLEDHRQRGVEFDRCLWRELPEEDLARYEGALIRALLPPLNVRAPFYEGGDNAVLVEFGIPPHGDEKNAAQVATAILHKRQKPYTVSEWQRYERATRANRQQAKREQAARAERAAKRANGDR